MIFEIMYLYLLIYIFLTDHVLLRPLIELKKCTAKLTTKTYQLLLNKNVKKGRKHLR